MINVGDILETGGKEYTVCYVSKYVLHFFTFDGVGYCWHPERCPKKIKRRGRSIRLDRYKRRMIG